MEQTIGKVVRKNKFGKSSSIQRKLEYLNRKLVETENKLASKEFENLEFCKTIGVLQDRVSVAEEVQNRLTEENMLLKVELKSTTSSLIEKTSDSELKCEESKAEYQILSKQLDLLENDVSNLIHEKKEMLTVIKTIQKSLTEVSLSRMEIQNNLDKANQQIFALQQLVSVLEFSAEERSTQNLALQQTITQVLNKSKLNTEHNNQNKSEFTDGVSSSIKVCSKPKWTERYVGNGNKTLSENILTRSKTTVPSSDFRGTFARKVEINKLTESIQNRINLLTKHHKLNLK